MAGDDLFGEDMGDGFGERSPPHLVLIDVHLVDHFIGEVYGGEPATARVIGSRVNIDPTATRRQVSRRDTGQRKGNRVAGDNGFVRKIGAGGTVERFPDPTKLAIALHL